MALTQWTKKDLLDLADRYGIEVAKSWTKTKIEEVVGRFLLEDDIDYFEEIQSLEKRPRGRGEDRASPKRIRAKYRKAEALELRARGLTYQEIADRLGYAHRSGARQAVINELEKVTLEPSKDLIKIELERLDRLLKAWFPLAIGESRNTSCDSGKRDPRSCDSDPDPRAGELVLRVMDRRAKFLGLDAAVKLEIESEWREGVRELGLDPSELFDNMVGYFLDKMNKEREGTIPSDDEF